jgi:hypothetical protein
MNDEYPPVAVLASAIAYGMFNDKTAEENLKKFCAHENLDISLMAVYSLLYFDPEQREPFVETIWKVRKWTTGITMCGRPVWMFWEVWDWSQTTRITVNKQVKPVLQTALQR